MVSTCTGAMTGDDPSVASRLIV